MKIKTVYFIRDIFTLFSHMHVSFRCMLLSSIYYRNVAYAKFTFWIIGG